MARIKEGRAANKIAPEFSGGGKAEAGPDVSADAGSGGAGADAGSGGAEAKAGSAVPVTATSSVMAARGRPGGEPGHPEGPKVTTSGTRKLRPCVSSPGILSRTDS